MDLQIQPNLYKKNLSSLYSLVEIDTKMYMEIQRI